MPREYVSPGLMSRPSLSGVAVPCLISSRRCVAGADVPAFVERAGRDGDRAMSSVAGADVPAFVERTLSIGVPLQALTCRRG